MRPGTDQLIETYIMTLTKYDFIPIPHSQLAEHAANKVEGNRDQVAKKKLRLYNIFTFLSILTGARM